MHVQLSSEMSSRNIGHHIYLLSYFLYAGPHSVVGNISDCRSLIPAQSHTFMEIDREIVYTAILLPSAVSRRVVVSYKRKYVH